MKAYIPVDIRSDFASFDVQYGVIRRSTHANTSWDWAKYEVYGHKWCDISESKFGVAVLNESKYGYSVRDNNIGLSLLKSAKFPHQEADMGDHEFVYSILPHERALEESSVFAEAYKLNTPLWAVIVERPADNDDAVAWSNAVAQRKQFIEIDSPNVVVAAFKRAEDDGSCYVLRVNEERGEAVMAKISVALELGVTGVVQCNSLEDTGDDSVHEDSGKTRFEFDKETGILVVHLKAYRIASFILSTQ